MGGVVSDTPPHSNPVYILYPAGIYIIAHSEDAQKSIFSSSTNIITYFNNSKVRIDLDNILTLNQTMGAEKWQQRCL